MALVIPERRNCRLEEDRKKGFDILNEEDFLSDDREIVFAHTPGEILTSSNYIIVCSKLPREAINSLTGIRALKSLNEKRMSFHTKYIFQNVHSNIIIYVRGGEGGERSNTSNFNKKNFGCK